MLERDSGRPNQAERCILIGAVTRDQNEAKSEEYLEELRFLAYTAGAETLEVFTQKLDRPDSSTFLGSGKMEEIKEYVQEHTAWTWPFLTTSSPHRNSRTSSVCWRSRSWTGPT